MLFSSDDGDRWEIRPVDFLSILLPKENYSPHSRECKVSHSEINSVALGIGGGGSEWIVLSAHISYMFWRINFNIPGEALQEEPSNSYYGEEIVLKYVLRV